jgi:hypothetical protein
MNPSSPSSSNPGFLDNLMQFLFGKGQLNNMATGQNPGSGVVPSMLQQGNSPVFTDQSQNNTQMQGIVNAYMAQKAAADQANATKKKKKQPVLAP